MGSPAHAWEVIVGRGQHDRHLRDGRCVRLPGGYARRVRRSHPDLAPVGPFLALRSYLPSDHPDKAKEIGSEPHPAAFIDTLLRLTAEWRRVLAPHGSIAVELGDTYSGSGGAGGDYNDDGLRSGQAKFDASNTRRGRIVDHDSGRRNPGDGWPSAKSACLIPELYRIALAYGINPLTGDPSPAGRWRVRNTVRWCRPNPPVGALGDKFRPATSDMVIACLDTPAGQRRYFDLDAVRTEHKADPATYTGNGYTKGNPSGEGEDKSMPGNPAGAPPLDWWEVSTEAYSGSHYACVDDSTEALTPHGWVRHDNIRDGDLVAVVAEDCESWRFEPAKVHRYPFDGELVAIDKRVTNQRLTPNHRVAYRTQKDATPRIRRADSLVPSVEIPLAAAMEPGGTGPGEKAAALAGWFLTEGGVERRGRGQVLIWQSESANPDKCERIRQLVNACTDSASEYQRERIGVTGKPHVTTQWRIGGPLAEWLRQFHKNLPLSAVFGWSDADARALFDALIDGDGHRRPDGRMSFVQKDRTTAERVQMLATRLGYRSTLSERKQGGWQLYLSPGRWSDLRSGVNGMGSAIGTERYVGTVWCPEVSTGIWLARRNGQPFITGNTWPRKLLERPIKAMVPHKVCTVCGEPSRRIVGDAEYIKPDGTAHKFHGDGFETNESGANRRIVTGADNGNMTRVAPTLGWTDCQHNAWRTGICLDPFGGSGTTGAVASGHGRDCLLFDLDERNGDLAEERIGSLLMEHLTLDQYRARNAQEVVA